MLKTIKYRQSLYFCTMKKLLFLFITIFALTSCENDFDLTEDWKDVTVVYGLLNQSDQFSISELKKLSSIRQPVL